MKSHMECKGKEVGPNKAFRIGIVLTHGFYMVVATQFLFSLASFEAYL